MSGIKVVDVTKALAISNSYDIVNAIRNSGTDSFRQYVPLANADNVAEVGAGILMNQTNQNEFITSLVDRIGKVVISQKLLQNPLKSFKKGQLPLGRTIEEIYVDLAEEKLYNPEEAEQKVFARVTPDVKTLFHDLNRKGFYKQTVQDSDLTTAFVSWGDFDKFVLKIVSAMYNSAEVDEYKYMKLLIDNYMSKSHFKILKTDFSQKAPATKEQMLQTVKNLRALVTRLTLASGSREFNSIGVHTRSDRDSLYILATPEFEASMDVDVLAQAFNMEKATLLAKMVVVDNFATKGLLAVVVDEDFFMVYDKLMKMETIRNPQGLYWNYFLHVWQLLSASRFQNAVAIVNSDYEGSEALTKNLGVTEIVLSPQVSTVKPLGTVDFEANVRTAISNDPVKPITLKYEVTKFDGTKVTDVATVISKEGVLKVGATEVGTLIVKCSVDSDSATVHGKATVIID